MKQRSFFSRLLLLCVVLLALSACEKREPWCFTDRFDYSAVGAQSRDTFLGFTDLDSALSCAKTRKKNLLLVFQHINAASTRGHEWRTLSLWGDNDFIQDHFVIAWLLTDKSKKMLDTTKVLQIEGYPFEVKTVGDYHSAFQMINYRSNANGQMHFLDYHGMPYGKSINSTKDEKEVQEFIRSGLAHELLRPRLF